jgi:hypothetical protein
MKRQKNLHRNYWLRPYDIDSCTMANQHPS